MVVFAVVVAVGGVFVVAVAVAVVDAVVVGVAGGGLGDDSI